MHSPRACVCVCVCSGTLVSSDNPIQNFSITGWDRLQLTYDPYQEKWFSSVIPKLKRGSSSWGPEEARELHCSTAAVSMWNMVCLVVSTMWPVCVQQSFCLPVFLCGLSTSSHLLLHLGQTRGVQSFCYCRRLHLSPLLWVWIGPHISGPSGYQKRVPR